MAWTTQLVRCAIVDDRSMFAAVVVLEGSDGGDGSVSVAVVPVQVLKGVGALDTALLLCFGYAHWVEPFNDITVLFRCWSLHEHESGQSAAIGMAIPLSGLDRCHCLVDSNRHGCRL